MLVSSWHSLKEVSTVLKTVGRSWQVEMLRVHYQILVASLMAYKNCISPLTLILQSGHSLLFDTYYSTSRATLTLRSRSLLSFRLLRLNQPPPLF